MTITIKDVDEIEERFKEVFATKDDLLSYKSDLMEKIEKVEKKLDISPAI